MKNHNDDLNDNPSPGKREEADHKENQKGQGAAKSKHDHEAPMKGDDHHSDDHGDHHGHDGHHGHEGHDHHGMIEDFKKRFWLSTILSIPVLALSPMIQGFFGFHLQFAGSEYVVFGLSTFIYFWGGWPFLKGLFDELKSRSPGMMTLIALAITVAYFYSSATVFGLEGMDFFWELVTLIDIMLLGHWIEMKSVMGASRSLELLIGMMPSVAHRVTEEGNIEDVDLKEVQIDDVLLIRPGEKVPADGRITEGKSYVNESMLTGESKPVSKSAGDKLIGGSINGEGSLKLQVEHTGEDSYLSKVVGMVQEAQKTKSKMQNFSDRAAKWLTYIALSAGFITLAVWLLLDHPFVYALERMVTVMVITCPHALGLAIPLVVAISTSVSAQNGLLIRNRTAFENSRKITAMIFDKTGTLTEGIFGVSRVEVVADGFDENEVVRLAAAVEQHSEHPIAGGIVREAESRKLEIAGVDGFKSLTGAGVQAEFEGKSIKVVSPGYLRKADLDLPENALTDKAETVVFVLVDEVVAGYIALADRIRPESADAIRTFHDNGIKVVMATGDNEATAKSVAEELGLDRYYSEVLPDEKVDIVKELQSRGEFVAMTGDGINDAPALAQADVGIAVGSGTDVAAETADIILVHSNPQDIAKLILFGKATYRKMIQNLWWATGYNFLAIPLAAGVLYSVGFVLSPAVGAVLMSLSTIVVAINAQLLRRKMKSGIDE